MISRDKLRPSRSDGLAGARFVVKSLVIISFLVLLTGYNYLATGQVPTLWSAGDDIAASTEHMVQFVSRKLRDDDEVRIVVVSRLMLVSHGRHVLEM